MSATDLPSELTVKAWMNSPEFTVSPDAFVEEAFATMRRENIRHLLVVRSGELVGVVTDRDLRRPDWDGGDIMSVRDLYVLGDELRIYDVMTDNPVTVGPDETTAHAAQIMVDNKFNCLPVMTEGRLVGILTSSDLLAALVHEVEPVALEARAAEAASA